MLDFEYLGKGSCQPKRVALSIVSDGTDNLSPSGRKRPSA